MATQEESELFSFRPYDEKDSKDPVTSAPPSQGKGNIEINVGRTRIVFQKTPPTNRKAVGTQPKKIPRVESWTAHESVSSVSHVSAVGMTTGSMVSVQQSHRAVVEKQLGMKISVSN